MVELVIHFEIYDHSTDLRAVTEVTRIIAESRTAGIMQFTKELPEAYIVDIEEV